MGYQFRSNTSGGWYHYVFAKNAQGDITTIYRRDVKTDGTLYLTHIADYEYDPWGKVLSIKDASGQDLSSNPNSSAVINPLRYRGYYYDSESGFYYLQSRYYDPEIKRFINADAYASTGQDYLGYNMFAYCNNNPVMYFDPTGEVALEMVLVACAAVVAAVATCAVTIAVICSPTVQRGWTRVYDTIEKSFSGACSWASSRAKAIAKGVERSFADEKTKRQYRSDREVHHIVAQKAPNALPAREALEAVGINVHSPENLISIKTGLHRRLHTNQYYGWANSIVISAYRRGRNQEEKRNNVEHALLGIRAILNEMDAVSPY